MRGWLLIGAALALAGGPCVADERMVSVRALVETVDISGIAISPDGRSAAFREERGSVASNEERSDWFVVDLAAPGEPLRVADGGAPLRAVWGSLIIEPPLWSPDSEWIYFRALLGEEVQVWRAARDGRRAEAVTHDAANVQAFALSEDGAHLTYRVGASRDAIDRAELEEYAAGTLFDETVHGGHNLFRSFPIEGRARTHRFNPDITTLLADVAPHYQTIELTTGMISQATAAEIATLEPVEEIEGEGAFVARGEAGAVLCAPCAALTIDSLAWRGDDELLLTVREDPPTFAQSLYVWSIRSGELRRVLASDGLLAGGREPSAPCAVGAQFAVCVHASPLTPPRLERIDLADGSRAVLHDPNARLADDVAASVRAERLSWSAADGERFSGRLILPADADGDRAPLLIVYYVCQGFLRGGYGDEWPLIALAGSGVAALCIDHPPLATDAVTNYETALGGVRAVVDLLAERGVIDPDRVGMGGLSFGSEVVTWIAGHSELLAAASIASAQATPTWYWQWAMTPGFAERADRFWGVGSPDETPEDWRRVSPAYWAEEIRTPLLMQTPEGEFRANTELYVRLVRRSVPTELWIFPEEAHQKFQPAHRLAANMRNLDWFRFWLQGVEDEDPAKAAQYERWSRLRSAWRASAEGPSEPSGSGSP